MLARSFTLNLLGQVSSLALGFVASIMLARWLGPADRGLLALMLTVSHFGYILTSGGLPLSVQYHASRGARHGSLLGTTLAYGAVQFTVLVPLFWFLRDPIADLFAGGRGGALWAFVAVLIVLNFLQWTTANQLAGMLRYGLYNGLFTASRIVYLGVVVALLTVAGLGVSAGLLATAAAALVVLGGALLVVVREERPRFDLGLLRNMLRYGTRAQVGTIFQSMNYRLDVIILQFFRPLREVGYYVVAQVVAELATTLSSAFRLSVTSLVSREEGDDGHTTRGAIHHHGIMAGFSILLLLIAGPLLILIAFGSQFRPALVPMFILLPAMWFAGTGTVVAADLAGRGRPGVTSALAGLAVVVTVALDLILIPPFGINGAALASVVSYVLYGTTGLIALRRVSGIPIRELVVPTRADFRRYPDLLRTIARRLRR
jgi:O-antigen/teichoic acid export membrane protein